MARTEVKLNNVYYKLKRLPTQVLANQMASKVGQGTSEYGDLTTWSAWVQQDWQDGVGKNKPHLNGGFLYGEVESRVPGQLILSPLYKGFGTLAASESPQSYFPTSIAGSIRVGSGGYDRIGIRLTNAITLFQLLLDVPGGVSITTMWHSESASLPSGSGSGAYTVSAPNDDTRGYAWRIFSSGTVGAATHWISLKPTDPTKYFDVAYSTTYFSGAPSIAQYTGTTWSTTGVTSKYVGFMDTVSCGALPLTTTYGGGAGFFRFGDANSSLYCYACPTVYKYDSVNEEWDSVGNLLDNAAASVTDITSHAQINGKMYFGHSEYSLGTGYPTMTSAEARANVNVSGHVFANFAGYLWKAYDNTLEYTSDGTTWEPTTSLGEAITVGVSGYPIQSMAGMGEDMYVATTDGLYRIAKGDFAIPVAPWSSYHSSNGVPMVNFEGNLYTVVNGRVIRISQDHTIQDVWLTRDDDLLVDMLGNPSAMTVMNNWLLVLVEPPADSSGSYNITTGEGVGYPTVWALQGQSWHHLMTLPLSGGQTPTYRARRSAIYYDRTTKRLWVLAGYFGLMSYYIKISDLTMNPYNDTLSTYQPTGWVEWDWFDGPVLEAPKDYESVTIIGENLDATCYVKVYWKDDDSTTWELLGTCDSNIEELRWTVAMGTRPNTRRFKLGLLLVSLDGSQTPRIRAIRVKYHLMVRDWFRWNVIVDASGRSGAYQMLGDGTVNNLTAGQIKDNLDALAKRVPPFIYQDVDGNQYEVKITDANFTYDKYEYNESTTTEYFEGTYNLQLEQVTDAEYSA